MSTAETFQEAAHYLLSQAESELADGVVRQASEKGWGAAAQALKAASDARGWPHDTHGLLFDAARRLVAETSDDTIVARMSVAHELHINFYENWLTERLVGRGLVAVGQLIEQLEHLPLPKEQ